MLTRKGLHYYVRQKDSGDAKKRDLFGEHEGSIALGNIAKVRARAAPPGGRTVPPSHTSALASSPSHQAFPASPPRLPRLARHTRAHLHRSHTPLF